MINGIDLWGHGDELTVVQMSLRALVIFGITLFSIRLAGRRSFGQRTAFDSCVTVLLGAILSRAVVGASPFWPVASASIVIVLLHRAIAYLALRFVRVDTLVNGRPRILVRDGVVDPIQMRAALISKIELDEAIRRETHTDDYQIVAAAVLEQTGEISIVTRPE